MVHLHGYLTDSVFYSAGPVVQRRNPEISFDDEEKMTEKIVEIAQDVQRYINEAYDLFAEHFLNAPEDHWLEIKQELIARRGLWIRKKRYAQWIIYDEGDPVQKADWKGLDVVRSDFPKAFKEHLENVLIDILHDVPRKEIDNRILDFNNKIQNVNLDLIANPTGVNKVGKYSTGKFGVRKSGTPIHVKAALSYNDLIDHLDIVSEKIKSGDKIRWVYLMKNPYNFTEMGYKGEDDPEEIMEFINKYVDRDKMYSKRLENKLEPVYGALDWKMPTQQNTGMDEYFSF